MIKIDLFTGRMRSTLLFIAAFFFFTSTQLNSQVDNPLPARGISLSTSTGQAPQDVKVYFNDSLIDNTDRIHFVPANDTNTRLDIVIYHPYYQILIYHNVLLSRFEEAFLILPEQEYYYGGSQFKRPCQEDNNKLFVVYNRMFSYDNDTIGDQDSVLFSKRIDSLGLKLVGSWNNLPPPQPRTLWSYTTLFAGNKTTITKSEPPPKPSYPPFLINNKTILVKKDSSDFSGTNCTELAALRKYGYISGPVIYTPMLTCYTGNMSISCQLSTDRYSLYKDRASVDKLLLSHGLKIISCSETRYEGMLTYYLSTPGNMGMLGMNELVEQLYDEPINWNYIQPEMYCTAAYTSF
jgi:hypothetical protein